MVKVSFFAQLKDDFGDQKDIEYHTGMTLRDVWAACGGTDTDNVLCARNHSYCSWDSVIADADELAFFPPVTGG